MFLMKKEEVQTEILKINEYLSKCLWMDFTLCQSNLGKIELYGAIDQTYNNYVDNYAIKIEFEQPHYVSSLFSWQTDTSKPFIQLVSEVEEVEINAKYRVELGNYIFKINVEDFDNPPIFIAAKKIICIILNEPPFPQNKKRSAEKSGGCRTFLYNAAKAANWTKPDGSTWWPPNNGVVAGTEKTITLQPGTLIDRYGNPTGYYTSPKGTPFTNRALSPMTDMNNYHVYEVIKPIQVEAAEIVPWFGESGGGIQYRFNSSINDLMNSLNGILREVK